SDAVGDPDAAEAAAGEEHAGMPRERAIDGGHAVQMADLVLRVAAIPAIHAREQRLAAHADERLQGAHRQRDERVVAAIEGARTVATSARTRSLRPPGSDRKAPSAFGTRVSGFGIRESGFGLRESRFAVLPGRNARSRLPSLRSASKSRGKSAFIESRSTSPA